MKSFKSGIAIEVLSEKYTYTVPTIIRNLKKNLGELKYKEFINKSKSLKEKSKTNKNQTNNLLKTNFDNEDFRIRRDSPLYKGTLSNRNFGALQNEDFEFVSVS